jgi:UDP-GlcNAc:undecaprenyl-phosphate/decaprenyl-phosphate GlcNAc-1-phosphate transferase
LGHSEGQGALTHASTTQMLSLLIIVASFLTALAFSMLLIRVAPRLGLVDHPGGRKVHTHVTPLVGGIAIAMTLCVVISVIVPAQALPLACATLILMAIGVADDIHEIAPLPKFFVQALACLVMIFWAGVKLNTVGDLIGLRPIGLWVFVVPMTVFALIGVINAINMVDGIDGHAGAVAFVAFAAYALVARESGMWDQYKILVTLAGGTLGFLFLNARWPWNKRARAFLGDAGSMLIGFLLGWFAIDLSAGNGSGTDGTKTFPPICALWVIVIPLCDCVSLMLRRRKAGRSMFVADSQHLHHYLLNRGLSVGQASVFTAGVSVVTAAIGIGGWKLGVPEWMMFVGFVALFVGYHGFMSRAFRTMPQFSVMLEATTMGGASK